MPRKIPNALSSVKEEKTLCMEKECGEASMFAGSRNVIVAGKALTGVKLVSSQGGPQKNVEINLCIMTCKIRDEASV